MPSDATRYATLHGEEGDSTPEQAILPTEPQGVHVDSLQMCQSLHLFHAQHASLVPPHLAAGTTQSQSFPSVRPGAHWLPASQADVRIVICCFARHKETQKVGEGNAS
jgi:hypothetical protein